MKINLSEIQFKIKFLEDKKLKAIVTLDFGEFLVKGFRVQESLFDNKIDSSQGKLWFTPPCYPGGGRYHPIFYIPNKDQWEELEKRFWTEYKIQHDLHMQKKFGLSSDELGT